MSEFLRGEDPDITIPGDDDLVELTPTESTSFGANLNRFLQNPFLNPNQMTAGEVDAELTDDLHAHKGHILRTSQTPVDTVPGKPAEHGEPRILSPEEYTAQQVIQDSWDKW
mgnify:CR=1 FL=1